MASPDKPLEIHCPCCGSLVVVDRDTGAVLRFEEVRKSSGASFQELLKEVGESKKKIDSKLQQALKEQKQRESILEKKFREAVKKAEETPDEPLPPRPFDLD
ncbi:MAG: hypothetical protein ACREAA_03885 [Candidatus Polarisedimenticolia bacterium]